MTETPTPHSLFPERVRALIASSVAGLDPQDRAQRIAWCREQNVHGVRMHTSEADDVLEFRWGGRTLAMVRAADLAAEDVPLRLEFVGEVADTVPDEWPDSPGVG